MALLLERPGTAVQLVGKCGRGKTTHLLALKRALPDAVYTRLRQGDPPPTLQPVSVLLLDEADAVWTWHRARLLRGARSVALAVHASHAVQLTALGFAVHTVQVGSSDPDRLAAIVYRRVEAARLSDGPVPSVPPSSLNALIRRHGDDVRAIEDELYSAFQGLHEVCDVQV